MSTRDTGDVILGPDLETGMTLRPNALPTNVLRWDAQSPRVARTAHLTSRCRTRGQNMELHKRYSTSASAAHGTVTPKKRKTWSFITSSSEPQNLKKHTNPDSQDTFEKLSKSTFLEKRDKPKHFEQKAKTQS